ncbi:hypothetical protein KKA72_02010 [Patescibacteria group bacterium]|nr:hypothetical protein [Patescibacteria group bacterium]MBU1877099.1 hypothetical protein [Patescibacteria group bacterium]
MVVQCIALWCITPLGKVLLKTENSKNYIQDISGPFKAWQRKSESKEGVVFRLFQREFGEYLPVKSFRLHFAKQVEEAFLFHGILAIRSHYLCKLPFDLYTDSPTIICVGKEDLARIVNITDKNNTFGEDIILYDFDCNILFKILGIQTIII